MNQPKAAENGYESRIRTIVIQLFCWCGTWAATCALLAFGPRFIWNKAMPFTLLAVCLNVCAGIGMLVANKRYLEELDELQRKVQLNSLAITVGVAFIVGVPYSLLDSFQLIPFHASVWHLVVLMTLTYSGSDLYGTRQYS